MKHLVMKTALLGAAAMGLQAHAMGVYLGIGGSSSAGVAIPMGEMGEIVIKGSFSKVDQSSTNFETGVAAYLSLATAGKAAFVVSPNVSFDMFKADSNTDAESDVSIGAGVGASYALDSNLKVGTELLSDYQFKSDANPASFAFFNNLNFYATYTF